MSRARYVPYLSATGRHGGQSSHDFIVGVSYDGVHQIDLPGMVA